MDIYSSSRVLPYVYKLTHKETGQFYFGSRYSKGQKFPSHLDILQYQTSSDIVKSIGFHNFEIEIIAEFFSESRFEDAWFLEHALIDEHFDDPLIINKHRIRNAKVQFMFTKMSEEGKENLRAYWKGKPKTEEQKRKMSQTRKGRAISEEHKRNISAGQLGRKRGPYKKKKADDNNISYLTAPSVSHVL